MLDHINSDELTSAFDTERLRETYDVEGIVESRDRRFPFDIPTSADEKISLVYQLLSHAANGLTSYQSLCFGYGHGTGLNEHAKAFNRSVVNPFLSHISAYFEELLIGARDQGKIVVNVSGGQGVQFIGEA